jgi:hypothetical protein
MDAPQSTEGVGAKKRSMNRSTSNEKKGSLYDIGFGHVHVVEVLRQ